MPLFNRLYQEAYNLFKVGDFNSALDRLSEAEKNYRKGDESDGINKEDIFILRGTISLSKGDIEEAQKAFENALVENPISAEASLGMGQVFYSAGMLKEAAAMIQWVVDNKPENQAAKLALEKIEEDISELEINEELVPGLGDAVELFDEAYQYFGEAKYTEALESVNQMQFKYEFETNLLKGNIYLGLEKLEEAETCLKKALELDKNNSAVCNAFAELYLKKRQFDDAKTMFEAALSIDPADQFALVGLAEVNEKLGLSPLNKLSNFFPTSKLNPETNDLINSAYKLFGQKNFSEALSKIEQAEKMISDAGLLESPEIRASLLNFKGFNCLGTNDLSKAGKTFEEALKVNPESSQACAGLAEVAYLQGEDAKAKIMFEWAIKNNPHNILALNGLIKINKALGLADTHNSLLLGIDGSVTEEFNTFVSNAYDAFGEKKYDKAVKLLIAAEELIDKDSENPDTQKTLTSLLNFEGFCYLALQDLEQAQLVFEEALKVNPKSSQACAGLGEIFFLKGEDENAKEMFEWAVRNEPLNKFAIAGLEKVNKELGHQNDEIADESKKEVTNKISNLIEKAYELFNIKDYHGALENLIEAEGIVDENYTIDESKETISKLNNFMGFNYLSLNKTEEARKCYEKSLERNPESSQAAAGLGEIFFLEENDEGAKQMFEWAVKNNPDNRYAYAGLAKVNKALGYTEEHNSLLEEA